MIVLAISKRPFYKSSSPSNYLFHSQPPIRAEQGEEEEEEEGRDRMINRFSQYLSRDHGNFSNIVPSIPSDNGISILPADKRSISPFGPHRSRQFQPAASTILFPKKDLLLWEDGTTSTSREVKFLFSCVFDFGN